MKKINLSFFQVLTRRNCLWVFLALMSCTQMVQAQCVISVTELTNVSLDQMCEATVTPDMVGTTSQCPGGVFEVIITDEHGNTLPSNVVDGSYVNQTLEVMIVDNVSNNSSWGYIFVEDKLNPVLECPTAVDLFCYELNTYAPIATDNCAIDTIIATNILDLTNPCGVNSFGDDVLRRVTMSYVAYDVSGNQSNTCEVTIDILRVPDLGVVVPPSSFLFGNMTNLSCDQPYERLPNGHPAPTRVRADGTGGTGAPVFGPTGVSLFPNQDDQCNIIVDYTDQVLPTTQCVTKIMRRWNVYEWSCAGEQRDTSYLQMIEIVDDEGPTFVCPDDFTASTNAHDCEATVLLPAVVPADNCSPTFTYNISYGSGFLTTNGGLAQLPVGVTTVEYRVFDNCGRVSDVCEVDVTVRDMTPPVTICDLHTTVSLTNTGLAKVPATVFDDGSYDECEFDRVLVRRMDTACDGYEEEDGDLASTPFFDDLFFEDIHFCCEDLGTPVMVVLRAYDKAGNFNDCMVEVQVQDKVAPTIHCPAPVTVNCDFAYDINDLDAFFGAATTTSNCQAAGIVPSVVNNLNQCNIGTLVRTFTVSNDGGSDVCTQVVTFQAIDLFNDGVPDNQPDVDINWPIDRTLTGCMDPTGPQFHPDATGYPTYNEGGCELVGANWDDEVFTFNNSFGDACFKIVRKWTVIDWCQFVTTSAGTVYPEWTHTQVIKVNDLEDPVITTSCDRVEVCTYDAQCQNGQITLISEATDNCTIDLKWSYKIDLNSNGVFENDPSLRGTGFGSTANATGSYPVGSHKIVWSFEDRCGNIAACEQLFDIVNCKAPSPYCLNGLAMSLMPIDDDNDGTVDRGMVEVWASDFDAGSVHPCGYTVYFSFEEVTALNADNTPVVVRNREFDCTTLGEQDVDVYAVVVTPMGEIIQDFCSTFIDIQDNQNACDGGVIPRATITGSIATATNAVLAGVTVELAGSEMENESTDAEGHYAFPSMELGGHYEVVPAKNDDYRNGVNTLDIVFIQRHILGLETLSSPYRIIAADVNSDESIKPSDLLALRKLILGVTTELPNTGSWKFIDAAYQFPSMEDPFVGVIPTTYDIAQLSADMTVDFVAVKVGDVNQDANVTGSKEIESRSGQQVELSTANTSYVAGEVVRLPLTITSDVELVGAQFTLNIAEGLQVVGVESEVITVDENNLGMAYAANGQVTFSWNDVAGVSFDDSKVFATLILTATEAGTIGNSLSMTSDVTIAEAYNAEFEAIDLALEIEGRSNAAAFTVEQNRPNPFSDLTTITFELPKASIVNFVVYDVTGKVVMSKSSAYAAGAHDIIVRENEITGSGIYYYQLNAGEYSATKKMVVIE